MVDISSYGKTNPDYGAHLRPKSYLEWRSPYLFELMLKVRDVFVDFEHGEYGYDDEIAEKKAVEALQKIVAEAAK